MRATRFLLLPLLVFPCVVMAADAGRYQGGWTPVPNYDLHRLLNENATRSDRSQVTSSIVATTGHSWPDGRQAIVTTLEVQRQNVIWLYRCIDHYDESMQHESHACYELNSLR